MTSTRPARVRYAPSPTGDPHIGNIRTAIWTWLYARHTGGAFLLRIEDTDQTRLVPGSVERIMASLRWLGLEWHEGPDKGGPHAPYAQNDVSSSSHPTVACSARPLQCHRCRFRARQHPRTHHRLLHMITIGFQADAALTRA